MTEDENMLDRFSNGVDWSEHALPTSHCWLPHVRDRSAPPSSCSYVSCRRTSDSSFVQCPICSLTVHSIHLPDLSIADDTCPPCRPSFVDERMVHETGTGDRHCWSHATSTSTPCAYCHGKFVKGHNGSTDALFCLWCSRNSHQHCWESVRDQMKHNQCDYGQLG